MGGEEGAGKEMNDDELKLFLDEGARINNREDEEDDDE
jgi:hypothetical protein